MKLEGIHHITCITGDAAGNVRFYTQVLGLRLVKKTVNQDDPGVYHLFYADDAGSPGADLTFFEYPGLPPGRPGDGMIHKITWRVSSDEALAFWEERLAARGVEPQRGYDSLSFNDPEGLGLELRVSDTDEPPLRASHPDIPEEFALVGFAGARAFASRPAQSVDLLTDALGFDAKEGSNQDWTVSGDDRSAFWSYDAPPAREGLNGAGTVHHIAWACRTDDQLAWRERVLNAGVRPTPVIDRYYFKSVYFREPSGVLFEIATMGPGFTADEPLESLGQALSLPPKFEPMREQIERVLTPLPEDLSAPSG